jgi:hypothetical protein
LIFLHFFSGCSISHYFDFRFRRGVPNIRFRPILSAEITFGRTLYTVIYVMARQKVILIRMEVVAADQMRNGFHIWFQCKPTPIHEVRKLALRHWRLQLTSSYSPYKAINPYLFLMYVRTCALCAGSSRHISVRATVVLLHTFGSWAGSSLPPIFECNASRGELQFPLSAFIPCSRSCYESQASAA